MKQKLKDLTLLIKGNRKSQMIVGGVVLLLLLSFVMPNKQHSGMGVPRLRNVPQAPPSTLTSEEAYHDIVERFGSELKGVIEGVNNNTKEISRIDKNMQDYEERTAEIFKKILERIEESSAMTAQQLPAQPGDVGPAPVSAGGDEASPLSAGGDVEADSIDTFGTLEEPAVAPPPPPPPGKIAFIGIGDSVRVKLLASVDAPTDGTPYPVVFKLVGDVQGPDNSLLPLGEARLVAAAQGSIVDSRALFRLTSLNIRLPNGRRKVIGVDGWIVGEDGLHGMEGLLIDPIGKVIGAAAFAGGLGAIGEGFAAGETTQEGGIFNSQTVVTGDPLKYGLGKGASGASQAYTQIIADRAKQLVPHVQVLSGREGTAIFARSTTIPDLFEALEDTEGGVAYASLD